MLPGSEILHDQEDEPDWLSKNRVHLWNDDLDIVFCRTSTPQTNFKVHLEIMTIMKFDNLRNHAKLHEGKSLKRKRKTPVRLWEPIPYDCWYYSSVIWFDWCKAINPLWCWGSSREILWYCDVIMDRQWSYACMLGYKEYFTQ